LRPKAGGGVRATILAVELHGYRHTADRWMPESSVTPTSHGNRSNAISWPNVVIRMGMSTHRAVHVRSAGAPMELVNVETVPPGRGQVRVAVSACGVCGTDHAFVNGGFPGISWPLTPGHEIAGTIAEIGPDVKDFGIGDRVAVGWFGGHCGKCIPCRDGLFIHCENGQGPSWH